MRLFLKSCLVGFLLGSLWGGVWILLLILFDLHHLFWTINKPLLRVYERLILFLITPCEIHVGLLLLSICFILTGLMFGAILGLALLFWRWVASVVGKNETGSDIIFDEPND